MTLSITARAAADTDLQDRVNASVYQEAMNNATLSDTVFAKQLLTQGFGLPQSMYWSVAVAVSAAYEGGLANGRGAPGHDVDVVTDAAITAAVVAAWPPDPVA